MRPISSTLLLAAFTVSFGAPATAQWLPYGTAITTATIPLGLATVDLGFAFTMPGGHVVNAVDVHRSGRVTEVGSTAVDSTESLFEMQNIPGGSINVLWDSMTFSSTVDAAILFYTDHASVAAMTWYQVGTPTLTTFQVQLHANGEIHMLYDSRNPADDAIVGLSPGQGAAAPPPSNLGNAIGGTLTTSNPTVYEWFGNSIGVDTVDWVSAHFVYSPIGIGGSNGWNVTATGGIPDPPMVTFGMLHKQVSARCPFGLTSTPTSYFFTPDGLGNYDITSGPSVFDPLIGASLGISADDLLRTGIDLGFMFPWPGGIPSQTVSLDPNGRILPSYENQPSHWTPNVPMHLTGTSVAPFWVDINVTEPQSGNIHFKTNPGVSATFTWNNTKQYDPGHNGLPGLTFQVQLYNDGRIVITHQDITAFNDPILGIPTDNLLVGVSDGVSPDPGEIDLTGLPLHVPIGVHYEFWTWSQPNDLQNLLPQYVGRLVPLTRPLIGHTWDLEIDDAAAASLGMYLIGTSPTLVDLASYGSPCRLLVDPALIVVTFPNGSGGMLPLNLIVPANHTLLGADIHVQGMLSDAPTPPFSGFAGLPWTFSFTNAQRGTIGEF